MIPFLILGFCQKKIISKTILKMSFSIFTVNLGFSALVYANVSDANLESSCSISSQYIACCLSRTEDLSFSRRLEIALVTQDFN